jgi:hypothetical protein
MLGSRFSALMISQSESQRHSLSDIDGLGVMEYHAD